MIEDDDVVSDDDDMDEASDDETTEEVSDDEASGDTTVVNPEIEKWLWVRSPARRTFISTFDKSHYDVLQMG